MDPCIFGMMAGALVGGCAGAAVVNHVAIRRERSKLSPYAHLLGKAVMVKKYEASEWERCVVVCVSWKGGVKVRRINEMNGVSHGNGFWIGSAETPKRVKEAEGWRR